jgi:hypothetical protein
MEGCASGEVRGVLDDPAVCAVRSELLGKLAIAEGEMERCWGEQFCVRAGLAVSDFRNFTYWDCYRHLVDNELHSLRRPLRLGRRQSVAFVGAGPLPLSAVLMNARTLLKMTCIDLDPRACSWGTRCAARQALPASTSSAHAVRTTTTATAPSSSSPAWCRTRGG